MRHVANLKQFLFNKINVLIMKKVIISALFVTAFSCGLFAKQSPTINVFGNTDIEVEKVDESITLVYDSFCQNTIIYWCAEETGEQFFYQGEMCIGGTEDDWYEAADEMVNSCD